MKITTWKTALLALSLVACSSGGGGEDEDPGPENLVFGLGTLGAPLTLDFIGGPVTVDLNLSGGYEITPQEWSNDTNTSFTIDTGALFGVLEVSVPLPLMGAAWDKPRTGTLEILHVDTGDVITLVIDVGSVDIYYDDGVTLLGPFTYSWEDLYALVGTSPAEYEEIASFAWTVVELARERFLVLFEVFVAIFDSVEFLESIGPEANVEVPDGCGSLPGSGTFGDGIYRWHDDNGDGLVSTNDSFTVTLEDCWVDSPGSIDSLYDGRIELTGFAFVEQPFSTGADVEFVDYEEQVTVESGGVYTIVPGAGSTTRGDSNVNFDER